MEIHDQIENREEEVNSDKPDNQLGGFNFLPKAEPDADNVDEKHDGHNKTKEIIPGREERCCLYEVEQRHNDEECC